MRHHRIQIHTSDNSVTVVSEVDKTKLTVDTAIKCDHMLKLDFFLNSQLLSRLDFILNQLTNKLLSYDPAKPLHSSLSSDMKGESSFIKMIMNSIDIIFNQIILICMELLGFTLVSTLADSSLGNEYKHVWYNIGCCSHHHKSMKLHLKILWLPKQQYYNIYCLLDYNHNHSTQLIIDKVLLSNIIVDKFNNSDTNIATIITNMVLHRKDILIEWITSFLKNITSKLFPIPRYGCLLIVGELRHDYTKQSYFNYDIEVLKLIQNSSNNTTNNSSNTNSNSAYISYPLATLLKSNPNDSSIQVLTIPINDHRGTHDMIVEYLIVSNNQPKDIISDLIELFYSMNYTNSVTIFSGYTANNHYDFLVACNNLLPPSLLLSPAAVAIHDKYEYLSRQEIIDCILKNKALLSSMVLNKNKYMVVFNTICSCSDECYISDNDTAIGSKGIHRKEEEIDDSSYINIVEFIMVDIDRSTNSLFDWWYQNVESIIKLRNITSNYNNSLLHYILPGSEVVLPITNKVLPFKKYIKQVIQQRYKDITLCYNQAYNNSQCLNNQLIRDLPLSGIYSFFHNSMSIDNNFVYIIYESIRKHAIVINTSCSAEWFNENIWKGFLYKYVDTFEIVITCSEDAVNSIWRNIQGLLGLVHSKEFYRYQTGANKNKSSCYTPICQKLWIPISNHKYRSTYGWTDCQVIIDRANKLHIEVNNITKAIERSIDNHLFKGLLCIYDQITYSYAAMHTMKVYLLCSNHHHYNDFKSDDKITANTVGTYYSILVESIIKPIDKKYDIIFKALFNIHNEVSEDTLVEGLRNVQPYLFNPSHSIFCFHLMCQPVVVVKKKQNDQDNIHIKAKNYINTNTNNNDHSYSFFLHGTKSSLLNKCDKINPSIYNMTDNSITTSSSLACFHTVQGSITEKKRRSIASKNEFHLRESRTNTEMKLDLLEYMKVKKKLNIKKI